MGARNSPVIECKSCATADRLRRRDAEQQAHSVNWFTEEYDNTCTATPVLVHKTKLLARDATTPPGTRIITAEQLDQLRTAIRSAAVALGDAGTWRSPDANGAQLIHHRLNGNSIISAYAVPHAVHRDARCNA